MSAATSRLQLFVVMALLTASPAWAAAQPPPPDPHAGHGQPPPSDPHAGHGQPPPPDPHAGHGQPPPPDPHAGHVMPAAPSPQQSGAKALPPPTAAELAAAFPQVDGHTVHDRAVHTFVLLDRLEWQPGASDELSWEVRGWVGGDVTRLWFRSEGETTSDTLHDAEVHAMAGRAFARWWEVVAGVRQDVRPGPAQTWAAFGVQGLAPYWFEVEATAYIGGGGRTQFRVETEYDLLLTNRLMLQPTLEANLFGRADPTRGIGAGLSTIDAGLRLRYEIRREFAPYVGISWSRKLAGTADLARAAGEDTGGTRLAMGVRLWY